MRLFIGTKAILAEPAEKDGVAGYKVRYGDGYESWSPRPAFEEAYRESGGMNFGHALSVLNDGKKVARAGWNGKDMFLFLVPGSTFAVNRPPLLGIYPEGTSIDYRPHIDMKTAQGDIVPWVASQSDVLAEDWGIVE